MKEVINRNLVSGVRHNSSLGFTYLNNPKSGCGHIKAAMWAQVDKNTGSRSLNSHSPHDRRASPFVKSLLDTKSYDFSHFAQTPFFTVVRNPFTRALSAYLSKIAQERPAPPGRKRVWRRFCEQYGVDLTRTKDDFSFKMFLQTIAADAIEDLNPHFRPQYINILYPFIPFKFVGKLEDMDVAHAFMADHGVEPGDYVNRPTGANRLVEAYYDDECEAIVREIYRDDFLAFGYEDRLSGVHVVAPVPPQGAVPNRLLEFLKANKRRRKMLSTRGLWTGPAALWKLAFK